MKLEHIDNLSKWKKSGKNIWSRKVSHRLRNYERIKYELALKNDFLEIDISDRINLLNLWEKVCFVKKMDTIVLLKSFDKSKIFYNKKVIFEGDLKLAKLKAKELWKHF